jgi:hypothetical protein
LASTPIRTIPTIHGHLLGFFGAEGAGGAGTSIALPLYLITTFASATATMRAATKARCRDPLHGLLSDTYVRLAFAERLELSKQLLLAPRLSTRRARSEKAAAKRAEYKKVSDEVEVEFRAKGNYSGAEMIAETKRRMAQRAERPSVDGARRGAGLAPAQGVGDVHRRGNPGRCREDRSRLHPLGREAQRKEEAYRHLLAQDTPRLGVLNRSGPLRRIGGGPHALLEVLPLQPVEEHTPADSKLAGNGRSGFPSGQQLRSLDLFLLH